MLTELGLEFIGRDVELCRLQDCGLEYHKYNITSTITVKKRRANRN
jgi:hypothetical protein